VHSVCILCGSLRKKNKVGHKGSQRKNTKKRKGTGFKKKTTLCVTLFEFFAALDEKNFRSQRCTKEEHKETQRYRFQKKITLCATLCEFFAALDEKNFRSQRFTKEEHKETQRCRFLEKITLCVTLCVFFAALCDLQNHRLQCTPKKHFVALCVHSLRLLAMKINIGHKGSQRKNTKKRKGAGFKKNNTLCNFVCILCGRWLSAFAT
jgi:hypothetical protein